MKKAIILVSFGSSNIKALNDNIRMIENDVKNLYGKEYSVFTAITSEVIIKKLRESNIDILSLKQSLELLKENDFKEVIIQPLYVIEGKEVYNAHKICEVYKKYFHKIHIGKSLIDEKNIESYISLVDILSKDLKNIDYDKVLFIGHGTDDKSHKSYARLQQVFYKKGMTNVEIGVLKGEPSINSIINKFKNEKVNKVLIKPLLLLCGIHAEIDINGDKKDSWKNFFEKNGIECDVELKGLGEYKEIRDIYIGNIDRCIKECK